MHNVQYYSVRYNAVRSVICEGWHFTHISPRGKAWVYKTSLTLRLSIAVSGVQHDFHIRCSRGLTIQRRVSYMEQLTLPEHLSSHPVFSRVRSLVFCVMFCRLLFVLLFFFLLQLYYLSFCDFRLLKTLWHLQTFLYQAKWSCICVWVVMHLCGRGIDFASFYDFDIWFWIGQAMWYFFSSFYY